MGQPDPGIDITFTEEASPGAYLPVQGELHFSLDCSWDRRSEFTYLITVLLFLDFNYYYLLELLLLLAYPCQGNYTPDTVVNFKRPTCCPFYLNRHQLFRIKNYY